MNLSDFAVALLDPEAGVPPGLVDAEGRPARKRFLIYRNNVASSLTRALEAGFPTVQALVGEECFAAMAGVFLRTHPPKSRILMLYGGEFPAFLEGFPPIMHLGYLPDVARLEQAIRESYHAPDSVPLSDEAFQRLLGTDIAGLRLCLAPTVRLVLSRWPVWSIWATHAKGAPAPKAGAEDTLVLRPDFDPIPQALPNGGGVFVAALLRGDALGAAVDAAGPGLDLAAVLGVLIAGRAIVGVTE